MTTRRAAIRVDYGNRSETWWRALGARLEARPETVPVQVRRLASAMGTDFVEVTPAEAREVLAWAASLPGWTGGPRQAPHPLRLEEPALSGLPFPGRPENRGTGTRRGSSAGPWHPS